MAQLLNPIDVSILLIVLLHVLAGWRAGMVATTLELASWVLTGWVALRLYPGVASLLAGLLEWPEPLLRLLAFILLFVAAGLLLSPLKRAFLRRVQPWGTLRPLDQLFGVLPGLVQGIIVTALLAVLLAASPFFGRTASSSQLAAPLRARIAPVVEVITPVFEEALAVTSSLVTVPTEPDEMVQIPYTLDDAPAAPELEARMLMLVNQERAANGLRPLEMDPELTEVARAHSADMFARGYFSHNTPEGLTPFDRIQSSGVRYLVAGENLAHTSTLLSAHEGLMNSPGHRANILNPAFGRVGIGILDGGLYGVMVTQNFRD